MLKVKFLCSFLLVTYLCTAQSSSSVQKAFVDGLNNILKKSSSIHWANRAVMTVEEPFNINDSGILAVTVKYATDTTAFKWKVTVPIDAIENVSQDMYIILECKKDAVKKYKAENITDPLTFFYSDELFHVCLMQDKGESLQELKRLFAELKKYKPII